MKQKRNRFLSVLLARIALCAFPTAVALLIAFPGCITSKEDEKKDEIAEKNIPEVEKENRFFKKDMVAAEVKSQSMKDEVVSMSEIPDEDTKAFDAEKEKTRIAGKEDKKTNQAEIPFYERFLVGKKEEPEAFQLNLDSINIPDLAALFAGKLGFSYILDHRLKAAGAISVAIDTSLTQREMWKLFEHILLLSGAYCAPGQANIVNIYPLEYMPKQTDSIGVNTSPNVEVRILQLKYTASNTMITSLTPFLSDGAKILDITSQNSILVVESTENFPKIEALVKMLDKKTRMEWPQLVLPCKNMMASTMRDELLTIMPVLGFPIVADNAAAEPGAVQITANDRLQVLVASAANTEALNELKKWINLLDRSDIGEQERVFVYKVVNSKADELLSAISAIFNTQGSSVSAKSGSSLSTSGLSTSTPGPHSLTTINPSNPPKNQPNQPPQLAGNPANSANKASAGEKSTSIFDVPAKIFSDTIHNRLIIRTTPRTYAMIKALLDRVDTIPAQVLLQVLIAEVTLDESTQFGLEFSGLTKYPNSNALYGTDYKDLVPGGTKEYGLKYWIQNSKDPADRFAYVRAAAGAGNTKVLSSPQIIAVSDTEAKIQVGDQVPIITQANTNTASSTATGTDLVQNYQYVDTGIILTIKPQITEGGLIVLDLSQEISDAVPTTSSDIKSPTIQKRNMTTRLAIRDGGTLIVGGLIWEKNTISQNSVPVIAKIPLLAALAGYSDIQKKRIELLVLITGTVMTEKTDLEEMTKRYEAAMQLMKEKYK